MVPAFRVQSLLRQSTEGAGIVELGVGLAWSTFHRSCNNTSQICLILRFLGPTPGLQNQKLWSNAWESISQEALDVILIRHLGICQWIRCWKKNMIFTSLAVCPVNVGLRVERCQTSGILTGPPYQWSHVGQDQDKNQRAVKSTQVSQVLLDTHPVERTCIR